MITPDQLVNREVHACISALVSTLAAHYGATDDRGDLSDLLEQAIELASPVDDWEEAALEAGWTIDGNYFVSPNDPAVRYDDAQRACWHHDIEPYQREVFEHWIISDWLADKLDAHGEKVDRDFAGLTVWARTTTGQSIAIDSVIETICAEINAAC